MYFEQVPVEVAKKILADQAAQGRVADLTPKTDASDQKPQGPRDRLSSKDLKMDNTTKPHQPSPHREAASQVRTADGGESAESTKQGAPTPEVTAPNWRELAQQIQEEKDPARMVKLAEQLIVTFDEETQRKNKRGNDE